jgi:hypothetical protein
VSNKTDETIVRLPLEQHDNVAEVAVGWGWAKRTWKVIFWLGKFPVILAAGAAMWNLIGAFKG